MALEADRLSTAIVAVSCILLWVDPTAVHDVGSGSDSPDNQVQKAHAYVPVESVEDDGGEDCVPSHIDVIRNGELVGVSDLTNGKIVEGRCRYDVRYSTRTVGTTTFRFGDATVDLGVWDPYDLTVMPTTDSGNVRGQTD